MEIIHKEITGSTNDDVIDLGKQGAANFTTVVADFQTNGRGRRGNAWFAEPGRSLLFSTLIRLDEFEPELWSRIPQIAAREFILATESMYFPDPAIKMKWPNDLYYYEKKWSGILVESKPGSHPFAVLGMGVNCFGAGEGIPEELRDSITTLEQIFEESSIEPSRILQSFLDRFSASLEKNIRDFEPVARFCHDRDFLSGKVITVQRGDETLRGIASGIGENGELIVTDFPGKQHRVFGGTILDFSEFN